jgi:catechol 2,3-dioxygenase-like lactoylglutathione lyase family enzyme
MVKFTGLNHLALATNDMDATIHFWRDLLGLRLVAGLGRPGFRQYFFELSGADLITFFEWPAVEKIAEKDHGAPVAGPLAFDHLSLGLAEEDDLWRIKDRLEAAGFWASEVIDHGFIHSLYAFDPNNIPIEFSTDQPGRNPRERPKMADRRPTPAAQEGPDPIPGRWPQPENPTPPEDKQVYPGEGAEIDWTGDE